MAEEPAVKDPETEAILAEIDAARRSLGSALQELRTSLNPFDWREWVARYPLQSAAGAALAGFMLAQPGAGKRGLFSGSLLGDLIRGSLQNFAPLLLRMFL
jgi:hypothetical protein